MEHLLDEKEAAAFLGVEAARLKRLIRNKVVPAYMIAGAFLRFKKSELEVVKDMLLNNGDLQGERIFNQAFSPVKGFERFREILRANDFYILLLFAIALIAIFMLFR